MFEGYALFLSSLVFLFFFARVRISVANVIDEDSITAGQTQVLCLSPMRHSFFFAVSVTSEEKKTTEDQGNSNPGPVSLYIDWLLATRKAGKEMKPGQ